MGALQSKRGKPYCPDTISPPTRGSEKRLIGALSTLEPTELPRFAALICIKDQCDIEFKLAPMKIALVQLWIVLAVILLIAGGGVAGLAGSASATAAGPEVTGLSAMVSHKTTGHSAFTDQGNHRGPCGECLDCGLHSTGSGCCSASLATFQSGIPCDAHDAVRFIAGKTVSVTGINPEALLPPPQIHA